MLGTRHPRLSYMADNVSQQIQDQAGVERSQAQTRLNKMEYFFYFTFTINLMNTTFCNVMLRNLQIAISCCQVVKHN